MPKIMKSNRARIFVGLMASVVCWCPLYDRYIRVSAMPNAMKSKGSIFTVSIFATFMIMFGFYSIERNYPNNDLYFVNAQTPGVSDNESIINSQNSSNADLSNVNITMFRGACFGACPIYYIEIKGDGKVTYRGLEYVNVTGEQISNIPVDKVRQLVEQFNKSGYYNLSDRYDQVDRTDQATVVTSINIDGNYKSVYDYLGTHLLPELVALRELENMIDSVTNSSQWVGRGASNQAFNSTTATLSPTR
jgi:Domain of unknown function (DUF6438)